MKVFRSISELRAALKNHRLAASTIGLVPTMGALHHGHMSLLEESLDQNDLTVCSIFVNPIQFNNSEDLEKYPRDEVRDFAMLREVGCDIVFAPGVEEMYGDNSAEIKMNFGAIETVLEGEFRPGHFSGVGVVVSKLFNIVQPDQAYFGQKDLQQLAVIKQMVVALNIPVEVNTVPILREQNGLAMSSRNQRLNKEGKAVASKLYEGLLLFKKLLDEDKSVYQAKEESLAFLSQFPMEVEYMELVASDSMKLVDSLAGTHALSVCAAAYISGVRIIDNLYIRL